MDVKTLIAANYPPYVQLQMLSDELDDGLVAYVAVVVDPEARRHVNGKK